MDAVEATVSANLTSFLASLPTNLAVRTFGKAT